MRKWTKLIWYAICLCIVVWVWFMLMELGPFNEQAKPVVVTISGNDYTVTESILKMEVDRLAWQNEDLKAMVDSQQWQIDELKEQLAAYNAVELTTEEFDLVCRIVAAEARGESEKGQQGVAQVIRDRYVSGYYGDSISDVIYAPYQFAAPWEGNLEDYPTISKAVKHVFSGKNVFDGTAIYFFNPVTSNQNAVSVLREGSTYFGVIGRHEFRGWTNE